MRICFLSLDGYVQKNPPLGKTDTGGQTVYVLELAKALSRLGIHVDVITRQFNHQKPIEEIRQNAQIIRIECGPNEFVVKERLYNLMPEFAKNLHEYIKKHNIKYDVIHSHYPVGGYAGTFLARKLKTPHVFTPHSLGRWKQVDMSVDEALPQELSKLYRYQMRIAIEKNIMHQADMTLMISEIQRIKLLQHYEVDFEKIKVVFPGVDTKVFKPLEPGESRNSIMKGKNRILLVSRFVPAKGIDRAIDIFHQVAKKIDCTIYIATSNRVEERSPEEEENEQKVRSLIREYKLEDKVIFLGFVYDRKMLAEYYRKTDIFLQPARFEPFGLTTMEAMACGAVTLVSRMAGRREQIIDNVNGFIVDLHDRKNIVKLILKIFADKKLEKRISESAYLSIQKKYDWSIIAKKIIDEVYKKVIIR